MQTRGGSFHLIFHQTKDGWREMPMPAGNLAENIRVSRRGTVWVDTWAGVSRWDGAAWRHYGETGSHVEAGPTYGGFALDGEDLWVLRGKGALHWDGATWKRYLEPSTDEGSSIVAGGGQAWIIDLKGNLSHFQDGKWESHVLKLPGVDWKSQDAGYPALARTDDGVVWLIFQGIWRFDGATWSRVTDEADRLGDAEPVGVVAGRLWFFDSRGLRFVSMNGDALTVSAPQQAGAREQVYYSDVASVGERTWFAANKELLEFNGRVWRPIALSGVDVGGISKLAAGPDGDLWIIGFPSASAARRSMQKMMAVTVALPIAILAVVFWIYRRVGQRRLQEHRRVTAAVQHATGQVSEELEQGEQGLVRSSSWSENIVLAVVYIGAIAGSVAVRTIWPKVGFWPLPFILIAIHLTNVFRESLTKRKPKESDPIGPGAPSRYDWGKTWQAAGGGVLFIILLNVDHFPRLKFLSGKLLWLLVLLPICYHWVFAFLFNRAMRRADYDGALKTVRWFYFYNPSGLEPLAMSGHTLLLAGRYREAEETLRRAMANSRVSVRYSSALEDLGGALMGQGRYGEATRSHEAAIHAFPWRRRPYRGMAEILLRQGKNPEQALEYVEKIIDFSGLSWRERQKNGQLQDDYWGLKAWTLALLGRSSEVAPAIEKALAATNKESLPDLASIHYYAGMAMQALGVESEAREYFRRAAEVDPKGRRGILAASALHTPHVFDGVRA